jgi:glycosyltransferase involved in cell wall biosynthesis
MTSTWEPGLVSVIIPAYNAAAYIGAALDSVLCQTHPRLEVIVVNDGSTDGTDVVLQRYSGRIVCLSQENQGQPAARNRGLAVARGQFVAFLDADDRWHPEKIERQLQFFAAHKACTVVHTARHVIDQEDRICPFAAVLPPVQGWCQEQLLQRNAITMSSALVRREVLGFEPFCAAIRGTEDWDLWLRLAANAPVGFLAEPLTYYRVHDANMSKASGVMLASTLKMLDRFLEREHRADLLRVARSFRHRVLLDLGHFEYERGDFVKARAWFRAARTPLSAADLQRQIACYLPDAVRARLRLARQTLERTFATTG